MSVDDVRERKKNSCARAQQKKKDDQRGQAKTPERATEEPSEKESSEKR